jgi:hypothetical protein
MADDGKNNVKEQFGLWRGIYPANSPAPDIKVLPFGTRVNVGPVEGVILGISIRAAGVRYEVGYWNNKEWKEVWFDAVLVESAAGDTIRIGFVK